MDAAESNEEAAERANVGGPGLLASLAAHAGIPIIHVSTDYVFDGSKGAPYTEDDPTSPTGVYGETKLAGERAVLAANPRAIILRTSWVYAPTGKNFIRTMLGAARKTSTLRVVADQRGCPTAAPDLADAILAIADRLAAGWQPDYAGVFHAAGTGETTWHGLATAAFEAAARHGLPMPEIIPITTEDWPTPARRPANSRLDCAQARARLRHPPARMAGQRRPHGGRDHGRRKPPQPADQPHAASAARICAGGAASAASGGSSGRAMARASRCSLPSPPP